VQGSSLAQTQSTPCLTGWVSSAPLVGYPVLQGLGTQCLTGGAPGASHLNI